MKLLNTLASIVLAAAALGPPSREAVQNEFKENLGDPDNARFRNVEIVPHRFIPSYFTLCGQRTFGPIRWSDGPTAPIRLQPFRKSGT
jgi:hypothetical protein